MPLESTVKRRGVLLRRSCLLHGLASCVARLLDDHLLELRLQVLLHLLELQQLHVQLELVEVEPRGLAHWQLLSAQARRQVYWRHWRIEVLQVKVVDVVGLVHVQVGLR